MVVVFPSPCALVAERGSPAYNVTLFSQVAMGGRPLSGHRYGAKETLTDKQVPETVERPHDDVDGWAGSRGSTWPRRWS
ncbi:hypothetical protein GCM10010271_03170 [Streptomyces kurssanovii]|nr:hypothetical protein GCM10010271_03170 [Streptomyces kurssanovii]